LATVARILVRTSGHAHTLLREHHIERSQGLRNGRVGHHLPADIEARAALRHEVVAGEECCAVVQPGLLPVQLIERVERQRLVEVLCHIQQVDRRQGVFHLRTGTPQRRLVERVDDVQPTLDEQAFAPIDHLLAQAQRTGLTVDIVEGIGKGIEQLGASRFRRYLTVVVIDIDGPLMMVALRGVIPVSATQEHPDVVAAQLQVMGALEHRRKHVACAVVAPPIVAVGRLQLLFVGVGGAHGGTERQGRVETTLQRPNIELHARNGGRKQAARSRQRRTAPAEKKGCAHS